MKKVFKIIVPFLLAALIIASLFWYFFIYDRNFTRDMLLGQARYHSTEGNPKLASWFYDKAYDLSDHSDSVAIELANQFKAAGNYTKAEYTLTNAIAENPSAQLYVALCKTYVQKDKLLDAVNMLDSIADPVIKAELDAMRPAAPQTDPEPGFYTEYISVAFAQSADHIIFSTDGEYPSMEGAPYSEAFTLPIGETVVQAVSVADNGLVSSLTSVTYTVGGVVEEVTFHDPAIEAMTRQLLNVDEDTVIYTNMLWDIYELEVPEDALNFGDLKYFPYLRKLTIQNHTLDSVGFLTTLSNLEELNLTGCRFSANEIQIIAGLPSLKRLTLADCGLSTVSGLDNARNLTYLDLSNNTIRNLTPLSPLTGLETLNMSHNALTGLDALTGLLNLRELDVSYNVLTSLTPITVCRNLTTILANNNKISDVSGFDNFTNLVELNLNKNSLTDVSPLGSCAGIVELDIGNNTITDIIALSALTNLELFTFSYNQVTELPAWPDGSSLRSIDGSYNQVASLENLKNMHSLTHIFMDYNALTSVDPIASCYNLVQVNVYGNEIENVDSLKEHEIIVNWDPTAGD